MAELDYWKIGMGGVVMKPSMDSSFYPEPLAPDLDLKEKKELCQTSDLSGEGRILTVNKNGYNLVYSLKIPYDFSSRELIYFNDNEDVSYIKSVQDRRNIENLKQQLEHNRLRTRLKPRTSKTSIIKEGNKIIRKEIKKKVKKILTWKEQVMADWQELIDNN